MTPVQAFKRLIESKQTTRAVSSSSGTKYPEETNNASFDCLGPLRSADLDKRLDLPRLRIISIHFTVRPPSSGSVSFFIYPTTTRSRRLKLFLRGCLLVFMPRPFAFRPVCSSVTRWSRNSFDTFNVNKQTTRLTRERRIYTDDSVLVCLLHSHLFTCLPLNSSTNY